MSNLNSILSNTLFLAKTLDFFDGFKIPEKDYSIIACQASEELIEKYPNIYIDEVIKGKRTYTTSKRLLDVLQNSSEIKKVIAKKYIWTYQAYSWTNDLKHSGKKVFTIDYFLFLKLQNKLSQRKILIEHAAQLKGDGKDIKYNLEKSTTTLKTKVFFKRELEYENLSSYYGGSFVVCASNTNGGEGVFKISNSEEYSEAIESIKTPVIRTELFLDNAIPLNQIGFITYNGDIIKYKPSVQIIKSIHQKNKMEYAGCDFSTESYLKSPSETMARITTLTHSIGKILYNIGYRGAFGCDFLAIHEDIHFIELNPRYQASTLIPNMHIGNDNLLSPHILHISGFISFNENTKKLYEYAQSNVFVDFVKKHKPIGFLYIHNNTNCKIRRPIPEVEIEEGVSKGYYLFSKSIIKNPYYPTILKIES